VEREREKERGRLESGRKVSVRIDAAVLFDKCDAIQGGGLGQKMLEEDGGILLKYMGICCPWTKLTGI
jgi:hypothetical protein